MAEDLSLRHSTRVLSVVGDLTQPAVVESAVAFIRSVAGYVCAVGTNHGGASVGRGAWGTCQRQWLDFLLLLNRAAPNICRAVLLRNWCSLSHRWLWFVLILRDRRLDGLVCCAGGNFGVAGVLGAKAGKPPVDDALGVTHEV